MKHQALFSSKDKSKNIKVLSAVIFVWRFKGQGKGYAFRGSNYVIFIFAKKRPFYVLFLCCHPRMQIPYLKYSNSLI